MSKKVYVVISESYSDGYKEVEGVWFNKADAIKYCEQDHGDRSCDWSETELMDEENA